MVRTPGSAKGRTVPAAAPRSGERASARFKAERILRKAPLLPLAPSES